LGIGHLVGGGYLDRQRVEQEFLTAALSIGLEEYEATATINSGLNAGERTPKRLEEHSDNGGRTKHKHKLRQEPTRFTGTTWASKYKPTEGKEVDYSFDEMVQQVTNPKEYTKKDKVPQLALAIFKDNYRSKIGFRYATGIVLDYDKKHITKEELESVFGSFVFVAHTTFSSTKNNSRWHIFIPVNRTIDGQEYEKLEKWAAEMLGGCDVRGPYGAVHMPTKRPDYQYIINRDAEVLNVDGIIPKPISRLITVTAAELIKKDIAEREFIVHPILQKQDLVMFHGYRGVGKTQVSLGLALAASIGGKFLKWEASRPFKTLFIDGEMPEKQLQERLTMAMLMQEGTDPKDNLRIMTPDEQDGPMPNFAKPEGQRELEPLLENVELLVLDNVSCLMRGIDQKEGVEWEPVNEWMLSLRTRGISIILFHHEGKGKTQRGTSEREDFLSTVIQLKTPGDYNPEEGCRFECHIMKGRALFGPGAAPFEAWLRNDNGNPYWTTRSLDQTREDKVFAMEADGMNQSDIAKELGINRSTVCRILKNR
jgi:hypothetical protein